jgi:hypothetical protein
MPSNRPEQIGFRRERFCKAYRRPDRCVRFQDSVPDPYRRATPIAGAGEAVCVASDTNVHHIKGVGTSNAFTLLVSGAAGDSAVITEGNSSVPSDSALQTSNLASDAFLPPFLLYNEVSDNIAIDPNRGVVVSADEDSYYDLPSASGSGAPRLPDYAYVCSVNGFPAATTAYDHRIHGRRLAASVIRPERASPRGLRHAPCPIGMARLFIALTPRRFICIERRGLRSIEAQWLRL